MVQSASADLLRELLGDYQRRLEAVGIPIDTWLAPGVSEEEVRRELAKVDLVSPDEVVVWFGWHNGRAPGVARQVSLHALPTFDPSSLAEAIKSYDDWVLHYEAPPVPNGRAPIPDEYFQFGVTRGWLRLINDGRGCAVECAEPSSKSPRLRSATEDFGTPGSEHLFQAVSLCTLVAWWIESLESGAFRWDATERRWRIDYFGLPETQRAVLFS